MNGPGCADEDCALRPNHRRHVGIVLSRDKPPLLLSLRVECIKVSVPRTDVDRSIGSEGGRAENQFAGQELPPLLTVWRECVNLLVSRAKIDRSVFSNGWRRLNLGPGWKTPLQAAVGMQRIKPPIGRAHVDRSIGADRRGGKDIP